MDQKPSAHHNRFPKKSNTKPSKKQKPLKVVYISNPIRVTTSADGFRGVVQELTGRDSDIADILARQPLINHPVEPCDALIRPTRQLPPELSEGDNSFKLMSERSIGGTEEYFAGLLPLSLLFDMEKKERERSEIALASLLLLNHHRSSVGPPPDALSSVGPPPDVLNFVGPPLDALSSAIPPPDVLNSARPPPNVLNSAGQPLDAMSSTGQPLDVLNSAGPPLDILNFVGPPPDTLSLVRPPPEVLSSAKPPPEVRTSAGPPPETRTFVGPPPDVLSSTGQPPTV
ncbi:hypothetical protein IEQ34_006468 [Dendrobium chrysotoxum]|uniref:VQ domain-containing protein n=1 Tax=Dendrobium chrysotoxum TaxID=161865 RepID=A0AAV7GWU9_DENCH|nr:hypothetical protein IEQ34_006468 [Dendrobium chrysotoxum]